MSVAVTVKKGVSVKEECIKCVARFWRLFPHLSLSLSLVAYAALGALMFQHIEGQSKPDKTDYHEFLGKIVSIVQNSTCKSPQIPQNVNNNFNNYICSYLSDICVKCISY